MCVRFDILTLRIYNFGMRALFNKSKTFVGKYRLLFLVLGLAALIRLLFLTSNPAALNWDEVSHGYNAYSVLKTGRDEWGSLLPLSNFRAYGDYPLALNLYLTIPFIAIFGLNEFSIRLPHALLGLLTVAATYLLVTGLTRSKKVSLLAALLVAIEPWSLFLSRFVVQSNLSVFFLTAALAAFFNRDKNKYLLPLSILFLGLTLYAYHTTRIVTPILLVSGLVIYGKSIWESLENRPKVRLLCLTIFLVLFVPFFILVAKPEAAARSKFTFIINEGAISKIIELRQQSKIPLAISRLYYNRPIYFVNQFTHNYIGYFLPKFLFTEGGTQYQFSVPARGLLYPVGLPFFYLGLFLVIRKAFKGETNYRFLLIWLAISPIPAAITTEPNAVVRASAMLPLPMIITAIAFVTITKLAKENFRLAHSRPLYLVYLIILALFVGSYLKVYFTGYRRDYSWSWQYGYKQAIEYSKVNYQKYAKIIVTKKYGEPHEFFLFFWPWNPKAYQTDPNLVRYHQSDWYWVDGFDKFYFVNDWQVPKSGDVFVLESGSTVDCPLAQAGKQPSVNCLLISSPGNYPLGWKKLETINFLDGKPAFEIFDNQGGSPLR